MSRIKKFQVIPSVPDKLNALMKIAYNIWWTWNPRAIDLLRSIDLNIWEKQGHNPIGCLGEVSAERYRELENSETFCSNMDLVEVELDWHLYRAKWFDQTHGKNTEGLTVAYFSAEYGLHESIPLYSGGLGILSGDHIKSADELGIPLIGVGLAYKHGYFSQLLNADGWQQEVYNPNDFHNMPTTEEKIDNKNLVVEVELPGRMVYAKVWKLQVGNIPLYLLDTNIELNKSLSDRNITSQLYGGDTRTRIEQEIILGVGGYKTLDKLDIRATAYHMNEGHSAFLILERIKRLREKYNLTFNESCEVVSASSIFTTHTPVAAGLDKFPLELIDEYFSNYYEKLGIKRDEFINLGRDTEDDNKFAMANLAISISSQINGVSKLHKEVSKEMWASRWKDIPFAEMPISSITNGIHTRTWLSDEMTRLFERYLGPLWLEDPVNTKIWERVDTIPMTELWRSQLRLKERLIAFAREKLKEELKRVGAPQFSITEADEILDPEALTICFARRFATYKRAHLIFKDAQRLARILNNKDYPVQIIFAGKAHPKDNEGKEYIKKINHYLREERFKKKIAFIEDYGITIGSYMVQGADIWLNNPRRPLEASGTSGMKAAANGGLNLSILDGWWCEGYNGNNGWAIGGGEVYEDLEYQDTVESNALYDLLEEEIVPLYYRRGSDGLPRGWIYKMKESIKTLSPIFNSNRMLKEYTEKLYINAHNGYKTFTKDNFKVAKETSQWKEKIKKEWSSLLVNEVLFEDNKQFKMGKEIPVSAKINLGNLTPEDVKVEIYYGKLDREGNLSQGEAIKMSCDSVKQGLEYVYCGNIECKYSGENGFSIRILPYNRHTENIFTLGLIHWVSF